LLGPDDDFFTFDFENVHRADGNEFLADLLG
jgi:hypothetical protein